MSEKPRTAGSTPATQSAAPSTRKEKIDSYVVKTLEHLQSLIETGNAVFPKDYSVENACKGAALHLSELKDKDGNFVLDVCTPSSIVNSIMGMCLDGLSVWKDQGYFIPYGKELHWQPDYRGNILKAKRDADVKEVNAQVIYEGDDFVYEVDTLTGRQKLVKHEPSLDNQDINKIKGAYAVVVLNDGSSQMTVMTLAQIKKSWMQGFGGGNTKAHQNFTDEMCKKTVINRAVKVLVGSADDSEIVEETDKPSKARDKDIKDKGKKEIAVHDVNYEEVVSGQPQKPADSPEALSNLGKQNFEQPPYGGKEEPRATEGPGY